MLIEPEIGERLKARAVCPNVALQDPQRGSTLNEFVKLFIRNFIYEKGIKWVKHNEYQGMRTGTMELDVHILTPHEYHQLVEECYTAGLKAASMESYYKEYT